MYLSFYCKGSKRVTQCFMVRGSWRPNRTAIYWPPTLMAVVVSYRSPGLLTRRPSSLLDDGFLYCILSGSPSPFGLVWLSLPHLVSTPTVWFLSWLSYIIVQSPLNHLLNLWNGMFDRHQAEITVMQFTGHSLPVHHSVVAQWDLHLIPYYQP